VDIKRTDNSRQKRIRRLRLLALAGLGIACAAVAMTLRNPGLPELDRRTAYLGAVGRGEMLRKVRGPGNLVARDIRWLTARSAGRVDRVLIEAGTTVSAETVLLTLDNPEIDQQAREARLDLKAAEAEHQALIASLENNLLTQRATLAQIDADLEQARFRFQAESRLEGTSAVSALDLNESRLSAEQLKIRREIELTRQQALPALQQAQLAASAARLEMLRERLELRQELKDALRITAGIDGVVQDLPVEQGQQLAVGAVLARVANPVDLKAELRISEVMARDVALHQQVAVDTRNGVVAGRV
jgi:HlyD family secretion protein